MNSKYPKDRDDPENRIYRTLSTDWEKYGIDLSVPCIMGVLNVTPDSFSDGGKYNTMDQAMEQIKLFEQESVDIIDIGGESSRPGAEPVPEDRELQRVIPVIQEMRKFTDIPVSVDTYKAKIADQALQVGANWINDISGLRADPRMMAVVKKWDCPVIIMHMKGNPKTMQKNPSYSDVIEEIVRYFEERIEILGKYGIKKIVLDPGIGFGKRLSDNLRILKNLSTFKQFGYPLMIGTSRKSFIGEITSRDVNHRLAGSISSVIWSVLEGVNIVRVHDAAETSDALKVLKYIREEK